MTSQEQISENIQKEQDEIRHLLKNSLLVYIGLAYKSKVCSNDLYGVIRANGCLYLFTNLHLQDDFWHGDFFRLVLSKFVN